MKLCRKGLHPRTPDNLYVWPDGRTVCRMCKRVSTARYLASPKGKEASRRAYARYTRSEKGHGRGRRYEASTDAWARHRRYTLKRAREQIENRLRELAAEEEELCRRSSVNPTLTR